MATAAPSWHVLLIGIDVYQGGVSPLGGCVNDIDAIARLLLQAGVPREHIRRYAAALDDGVKRPTEIPTHAPTLSNLVAALTELGSDKVKAGDRVFIYYSGHGTHRYVSTAAGEKYYREALVPTDNVIWDAAAQSEREQLLFDWQLNSLLGQIAARTSSVCVVLDCCCSAGATRELPAARTRTRFLPPRAGALVQAPKEAALTQRGIAAGAASLSACMVVCACLDDETARESASDDSAPDLFHGELTRGLLAALAAVPKEELLSLRWAQVWRTIVASVSELNPHQHPWLSSNPARLLLGGPPTADEAGYGLAADSTGKEYVIDAGSLSGVTTDALIAVYPPIPPPPQSGLLPALGTPEDLKARLGMLRVTHAERARARAVAHSSQPPPAKLPPGARARMVRAGRGAKLRVSLSPYDSALAARLAASPLLQVLPAGSRGELELAANARGDRELTDDVFGPDAARGGISLAVIPAAVVSGAPARGRRDLAVALVEHYYAYSAPLRAARGCTDLPHLLRVKLLDCGALTEPLPREQAEDYALSELQPERWPSYELRGGVVDPLNQVLSVRGDQYIVQLENAADTALYVTLFLCEQSGCVRRLESRVLVGAHSRTRCWYGGQKGTAFAAVLPTGATAAIDRLVAIGTTNRTASLDYLEVTISFADVADGVVLRSGPGSGGSPELWTAASAVLRMRQLSSPQEAPVPSAARRR